MNRARIAAIATLVGVSLAGSELVAQQAPEMKPILAGRKVEQAFKGQAEVEFTSSSSKSGDAVVTTMKVKPRCSRSDRMVRSRLAAVIGSSPAEGSSSSRMSQPSAIARAMPARFSMPPESSPGISDSA